MKVCNSEAMKEVKTLEERKRNLIYAEENRSRISYREGEEKIHTSYDYNAVRKEIAEIDGRIRKIKHALALSNCTALVEAFDMTIGEALVYLAQLNAEYGRLDGLSGYAKLDRRLTANGVLEYTECLYDPDRARSDAEALHRKICALQVAIDRANLTNCVDI